ncbi:MAG: 23S rRNA (uracil(1939)-C(5))-methyltransferase RlmD [Eubacteriaceae bacterium]|jgi:23S rRNA (uracil-5-)-methyltransferase RumA|nr:23S rRNA (uracil(1939)-C(5))-methyltransferase RlmD [Eubacteriaceae bacterium]
MAEKTRMVAEMEIDESVSLSKSISHYENAKVLIDGGYEGQRALVEVRKKRHDRWEGKVVRTLRPSPLEIEPACPHFGKCGGCRALDLQYEKQLEIKQRTASRIIAQATKDCVVEGILPSPLIHRYRNKMEFSFGDEEKGGQLTLGLHGRGRHHDVVSIGQCLLCPEDFSTVARYVEEYFRKKGAKPYNAMERKGWLRHLVLRRSSAYNELLIGLVATGAEQLDEEEFVRFLLGIPTETKICGVLFTKSGSFSDTVEKGLWKILYGRGFFRENVAGIDFEVSFDAFLQTNMASCTQLYATALSYAGDLQGKTALDLYCGIGTISEALAQKAVYVLGAEIVETAVIDAKKNAIANGMSNISFVRADVGAFLKESWGDFSLCVADPPRAGIGLAACEKIASLGCERIVYVSCKPSSFSEDAKSLEGMGYRAEKATLVDMFPHTDHVEIVSLLTKI